MTSVLLTVNTTTTAMTSTSVLLQWQMVMVIIQRSTWIKNNRLLQPLYDANMADKTNS